MNSNTLMVAIMVPGIMILVGTACDRHHDRSLEERMKEREHDESTKAPKEQIHPEVRDEVVKVSREDRPPFYTLKRTGKLERFRCSNCHTKTKTKPFPESDKSDRKAHWKITLNHWEGGNMNCSTCHGNESSDQLETTDGRAVPFDRPAQLCETCHGKQVQDWKGGAHGKQYRSWKGPQVRYNCTTCHDPHDPSFKKKWPETAPPNIPRKHSQDK